MLEPEKWPQDDVDSLLRLHRELAEMSAVSEGLISADQAFSRYLQDVLLKKDHLFLRMPGSENAFCHVRAMPDSVHLNHIYVRHDQMGRGAGKTLFRAAVERLSESSTSVTLDVFGGNTRALGWYGRVGFKPKAQTYWMNGDGLKTLEGVELTVKRNQYGFRQVFQSGIHIGSMVGSSLVLSEEVPVNPNTLLGVRRIFVRSSTKKDLPVLETSIRMAAPSPELLAELGKPQ